MSSKFHKIKKYEVREDALKYLYDLSDCFLVLWSNQHGFLEAVDDIFEHLREYCPLVRIFFVYNKNTSIKKEKETSSTLTNTKYLKECCKRYRVTFLKKTNLKKCDKKKIEKMLLKMMPKTLDDLCENSDFDLTVKDLYETEINDLDQSSFLDSSLDTSLNTTFGSTF